ncbi:MAG TPA: hypothetical protein VMZ69_03075 [Saprospiraceae bacterium]|nr:hypothetical protein [Saprospiraceae bacterium]
MRNLLAFPDESRVWIYQADRPFDEEDITQINNEIDAFCIRWTSHNKDLRAIGGVMHDQFIVLVVDETQASTSGCSIDKSVAFVKSLEQKYNRNLLQRDRVAWLDENEQIHTMPLSELSQAVKQGQLNMETRIFDNLVAYRRDYISRWTVPLGNSWMKKFA